MWVSGLRPSASLARPCDICPPIASRLRPLEYQAAGVAGVDGGDRAGLAEDAGHSLAVQAQQQAPARKKPVRAAARPEKSEEFQMEQTNTPQRPQQDGAAPAESAKRRRRRGGRRQKSGGQGPACACSISSCIQTTVLLTILIS